MVKSWGEETLGGKIKLIAFSLTPLAALLVGAELMAGLAIQREFGTREDPATGLSSYWMRIGGFPWSRESVTPLNSQGFPDGEFDALGTDRDCIRVVFAGDSFVFGDGVDRDANFFELVKRRASQEADGPCVRWFNISERATTIEQQSQRVRESLDLLDPDIVVLGQYQNDLTDLTKPGFAAHGERRREPGGTGWADVRARLRVFDFSLLRYLSYRMFAVMITHGVHYDVLAHWSVLDQPSNRDVAERLQALYEEFYDELAKDLMARRIAIGVLVMPSKFDVMAGRSPEEAFFVRLADERGIPYLRLLPALDSRRSPYPFLLYDGHLNEQGNKVVAEAVFEWFFRTDAAPFPQLRG